MLVSVKPGADSSRGCVHPAARPLISTTHPRPLLRELALKDAVAKVNGAAIMSSTPFARSGVEVLCHKLVDVVIVAVVYAVDVA
jgi:hypothetical protein